METPQETSTGWRAALSALLSRLRPSRPDSPAPSSITPERTDVPGALHPALAGELRLIASVGGAMALFTPEDHDDQVIGTLEVAANTGGYFPLYGINFEAPAIGLTLRCILDPETGVIQENPCTHTAEEAAAIITRFFYTKTPMGMDPMAAL